MPQRIVVGLKGDQEVCQVESAVKVDGGAVGFEMSGSGPDHLGYLVGIG